MIVLAAVSLLLMSCFAAPAMAAETTTYRVTFEDSVQYLQPNEAGTVQVQVSPDRPGGNYDWNATVSSGAVLPTSGTNVSADNITLKVAAGTATGDLVVTFNISNGTVDGTAKHTIKVIDPVVITAQVQNVGNVTMNNVPVQFKADGAVVNSTFFTIPANSTKTLTYNWTAGGLSNGQHTVEIVLDPDNKFVNFLDGTTTFSSTFQVGESWFGWANIILGILVGLLLVILFFTYMGRGKKRKK
jgi:subtilase family serine protease